MPSTFTTNYNLEKPEHGGNRDNWGLLLNSSLDKIDTQIKLVSNVANAALPLVGGTITSNVTFSGNGNGVIFANGGKICDDTGGTFIMANADNFRVYKEDSSALFLEVNDSNLLYKGQVCYHTGNFPALGYLPNTGGTVSGNVSINNSGPTLILQDTDNMPAFLHCNSDQFYVLRNATANAGSWDNGPNSRHPMTLSLATGSVVFSGDVSAYSDERLKKNITTVEGALELVKQMRGVHFERLETEGRAVGVVAQEMQKVLPEVVSEDKDGMLAVSYANIVAVLIEAVKELSAKVEALEAR